MNLALLRCCTQAARRALRMVVAFTMLAPFGLFAQGTGLILATPDQLRGVPMAHTPFGGQELPAEVDLSPNMPTPGHQGSQNSCVGWALAYALKTYQEKIEERWQTESAPGQLDATKVFSPSFIYNQINRGRDGGSPFIDGLKLVSEQGCATWADMPYVEADYLGRPSAQATQKALPYRIDYWRQVNVRDAKEVKAQIGAGLPVLIGVTLDEGFNKAGPGFVWNKRTGKTTGGHAMILVGYSDRRKAFKVLNSYGTTWGDKGYAWIDYDFFTTTANEGYVASDARNRMPTPAPVPQPQQPPQNPYQLDQVKLVITDVKHNVPSAALGNVAGMQVSGRVTVTGARSQGRAGQIVVFFYSNAGNAVKGIQVASTDARFANVHGFAACGTIQFAIGPQGIDSMWTAYIPYTALSLQYGYYVNTPNGTQYQSVYYNLLAEPILYLDNFGVASGGVIPFQLIR